MQLYIHWQISLALKHGANDWLRRWLWFRAFVTRSLSSKSSLHSSSTLYLMNNKYFAVFFPNINDVDTLFHLGELTPHPPQYFFIHSLGDQWLTLTTSCFTTKTKLGVRCRLFDMNLISWDMRSERTRLIKSVGQISLCDLRSLRFVLVDH